ncbi:Zn-dependent exopeptidase [Schizopora paradoxa]|uniref:Zn-dependent exopeptidase n=1 Tax=Schizopora paradoxa TaxID=27342 RepID=A0A0H2RZW8_9AGAM|nr:Zn-dependent exopeptidase [Schizopora paradoxa]
MPCSFVGSNEDASASASIGLDPPPTAPAPRLAHSLRQEDCKTASSVLSVAADERHIYSGSQNYDIYVWDKDNYSVKTVLRGHTGSVLDLEVSREKKWLFSSAGDSTVRIWCTEKLIPLYIINPYLRTDAGDIFCIKFSHSLQTLYLGCQNTALQWFDFNTLSPAPASSPRHNLADEVISADKRSRASSVEPIPEASALQLTPRPSIDGGERAPRSRTTKRDKFFSGYVSPVVASRPPSKTRSTKAPKEINIEPQCVLDSAHFGYIYSMTLVSVPDESGREEQTEDVVLLTGGGDETVKMWNLMPDGPILAHSFDVGAGAILALVVQQGTTTAYAGCQDGQVKVIDLEMKAIIRTIIAQEGVDILSLSLLGSDLYTCSANGEVQRWSASFDCVASWHAHEGIILCSRVTQNSSGHYRLLTGGNDNCVNMWHIDRPKVHSRVFSDSEEQDSSQSLRDTMLHALTKFVSFPSVSNSSRHREDCRQAAIWLKKCLVQLGAEASLVSTSEAVNPLVLATFRGSQSKQNRTRILFYGHYDVIAAPPAGWMSDPFTLTGRNGYYYGRGATDNKGPILAVACATSELLRQRALDCDLVMLLEGEEEAGSIGFSECVKRNKDLIGHVDAILVSNSTWISEDRPCITYGLRGVIHCSVIISSDRPDLHSGVDGGGVVEPMLDMVKLLATLSAGKKVLIPGFYDAVLPQDEEEKQLYKLLSEVTGNPPLSLSSRWREPSLTIHNVTVSGPGNSTVIPGTVKAKVSLRIVPDQDLDTISKALVEHLHSSFAEIQSPNILKVNIDNASDWWLGDIHGRWFKALENSIQEEWGIAPLRIREGGSIPSVPFLEKEFGCGALHLPLGQSLDRAHLPNERVSLNNLRRGKSVVERFLKAASSL